MKYEVTTAFVDLTTADDPQKCKLREVGDVIDIAPERAKELKDLVKKKADSKPKNSKAINSTKTK